jgi:serine protease Do
MCNVPPAGFVHSKVIATRFDSQRGPAMRPHGRGARRLSCAALLAVWCLLAAWLQPREMLAANSPAAPQQTNPSQTSTNQPAAKASPPTEPQIIPKPLPGVIERYPLAFRKPAPASVDDLKAMEARVKSLVARVSPAVVAVMVTNNFGAASGSAVVISKDGLVLCAAHVCDSPNRDVTFTFPDGRTAKGKTLGTNHEQDSGLMKITDPGPWPCVPVGDLNWARLGDWVLALGHPGGFDPKRPVVARLGRIIMLTTNMLQTDCTLLGGDSGGPLFDMSGRVIGIHSRISVSTEENFHVAISTFLDTWDRLARGESWGLRPSLRVYIGAIGTDHLDGCRLERIDTNSPASRAGLKVGDIVVKFNNQTVKGSDSFQQSLAQVRPGTEVTLQIKRDNKEMSVRVTVESRGRRGRGRFGGP